MKIIIINESHGSTKQWVCSPLAKYLAISVLLALPALGAGVTRAILSKDSTISPGVADDWREHIRLQREEISEAKQQTTEQLDALKTNLAAMQARLLRLDALGERLISVAKLDADEFDFSVPPSMGGPEDFHSLENLQSSTEFDDFFIRFGELETKIDSRERQLEYLEDLLDGKVLEEQSFITGRPITDKKGWMSSPFGRRTDPFTGRKAWHKGQDYAGHLGSDIVAVAGGVVTFSGEMSGYGKMVEIDHGEGIKTRYGHNSKNTVKMGEIVKRGHVIALMGSSGRSTGPHVHFEVLKNGRQVDPASYVRRSLR